MSELPDLPQCWTGSSVTVVWGEDGETTTRKVYTDDQMRRYALDAIELSRRPDPAPVGVRVPDAERWTPKYVLTALCDLAQDADQFNNGLASEIIELVAKYRSSVVLEPQAASLDRVSYVIGKLQKHAAKADARSRNRSGGHDDGVPSHTAMLVGETVELIRALKQRETLCAEKIDTAFVACCLSDYLECLREGIVRYGADNLDYLANQITALRLNPRPGAELLNNDPTSSKLVDEQPGAVVGDYDISRKAREVRVSRAGACTAGQIESLSAIDLSEEVIEAAYQAWRERAASGHSTNRECVAAALRTLTNTDKGSDHGNV